MPSKGPVFKTLAELKGMKVRVPGAAALHIEPLKHFGGVPVSVPPSHMLPALQNKPLDGLVGSPFIWIPNKYYDVAKHQTYLPGSYLMAAGIASRTWLKSLGPELEAIVREEAHKADALITTQGVADTQKALGVWEKARDLAGGAVRLSLDPQTTVFELAGLLATLAPDQNAAHG